MNSVKKEVTQLLDLCSEILHSTPKSLAEKFFDYHGGFVDYPSPYQYPIEDSWMREEGASKKIDESGNILWTFPDGSAIFEKVDGEGTYPL